MKRAGTVVFATLAAFLVATTPAAAATNPVVASQHTDFGTDQEVSPNTLNDVNIEGSGNGAYINFPRLFNESFEDGTVSGWSETVNPSQGSISAQQSTVISGAYSAEVQSTDPYQVSRSLSGTPENISFKVRLSSSEVVDYIFISDGRRYLIVRFDGDGTVDLTSYDSTGAFQTEEIRSSWSTNTNYEIELRNISWGGKTATADVYIDNTLEKQNVELYESQDGDVVTDNDKFKIQHVSAMTSYVDDIWFNYPKTGTYIGASHSVSDAVQGKTNLSLSDAKAHVTWQEYTGSQWQNVASATYTTSGNKSLSLSGATHSSLRVNVTFEKMGANPTARLHDESVLFNAATPTVDNSSATPQNNNPFSSSPATLSIEMADADFPLAQSDTVTGTFYVDGSQVGTDMASSNGTISTTVSGLSGGSHTWHVIVEDSYGFSQTSKTFTFKASANLTIRNETNYSDLVPASGEVRFISNNNVYTRTTTSGQLDLSGLPVGQDFIVDVDPTDSNYTDRTIYLQSIYEQRNVYVLNTSAYDTVTTRFVLNDPTAQFGPNSILQIQKAINISGNTTFEIIKADEFGTEGVTATLHKDQRYHLKIVGDGVSQSVGVYRSDVDGETVTVQPGSPTIGLDGLENGFGYNAQLDNRTLEYLYSDPSGNTSQLVVWIHERGNPGNKLQPNKTAFDIGNFSGIVTPQLTENESKKEWVVNFVITRNGETFTASVIVSNNANLTPPVAKGWIQIMGVGLLILLAGAFSVLNAAIGAVVVALVGGVLWYIGFLGGATTGAAVAIAIFLSAIMYMYKGAYP